MTNLDSVLKNRDITLLTKVHLIKAFPVVMYGWESWTIKKAESESEVAQSYPTLCNPMDYRLPGSSLHGILQARILEWVTISFSRGSSQHRGSNPGLLHWRQTLSPLSHGPKNEPRFKPHSTTKELSDSGPLTQTL